jgi:hypothetical protein
MKGFGRVPQVRIRDTFKKRTEYTAVGVSQVGGLEMQGERI